MKFYDREKRETLTYYGDGVRADHVLRELRVGSVADDNNAATVTINAERHVRAGDPAAVWRQFRLRGVAVDVMTVYRPLDVRGRVRVFSCAGNEHLFIRLRFCRPGDGDSGGCNC